MTKTIKNNFFYNLILQMSKVLFPLITAPYIARVLEPDGVGLVNFVGTYSAYFALFAVLGIPMYGIREIAKIKNNIESSEKFVSQMISIELVSTLFVSLVYILSVLLVPQLSDNSLLFIVAGLSLYITPFKIEWFFSGREEFGFITFRSLIIKTVSVVMLFLFVKSKSDILVFVLLSLFASIANEVWNYIKLFKLGVRPHLIFTGCKIHLKAVLALFASSIAVSIYVMLDTLMLGVFSSYAEVGFYNSAMHVIKALLPVATALSAVAVPRVASYIHEGRIDLINELMNKSISVVSFLAFPLTVGIIAVSPAFVPLFYGLKFDGAIIPMQVGSILLLSIGLNNLNGVQILIGMGKDKQFLYSVLSGAITNFFLNLILIPQYGAVGASIASVIAETQILFVNEYFVRKYTQVRVSNFKDLFKSFLGALIFIPICYCLSLLFKGWWYVITSLIVCPAVYIYIQYSLKNDTFSVISQLVIKKIKR